MKAESFLISPHDFAIGQWHFGKDGIIFQNKQVPASMIYNNNGDTDDAAGMINCGIMQNKSIQIIGNRASGSAIRVQVWGKANQLMGWSNNLIVDYDASGAFTDWIMITERMTYMRVGIQLIGGASTVNDWIYVAINIGT